MLLTSLSREYDGLDVCKSIRLSEKFDTSPLRNQTSRFGHLKLWTNTSWRRLTGLARCCGGEKEVREVRNRPDSYEDLLRKYLDVAEHDSKDRFWNTGEVSEKMNKHVKLGVDHNSRNTLRIYYDASRSSGVRIAHCGEHP